MRDTKLYKAVLGLNGFELNRLHRFVLSPYFNQNERIIKLFEWIKSDLKNHEQDQPTKEVLWSITFGSEDAYDDGRFRKLQSDCLKLIEDFFAQEVFTTQPLQQAKYLLDSILENDLDVLRQGAVKTTQRLIEKEVIRSSSYYYYQYEFERSLHRFQQKYSERSNKYNIENIALSLDQFFLGEKLKYYCELLSHKRVAEINYEMLFMNEIMAHIKLQDYSNVPSIDIYYQIIQAYKDPLNKSHYDKLKFSIEKYIHLFPPYEAKEIFEAALNYSLGRMNAGIKEYIRETFDLYRQSLNNGVLLVKGKITPWSFKNIVTTGLRLGEFEWVEQFIFEYSDKLDERFRENAMTFNLAQLYFYKKDYHNVIAQLSKVEYEDLTYVLNSKTLLMASYYELEEFEALNSLLDTFRIYLSRNQKVPGSRKSHYMTTIGFVRKLARIKHGDTKSIDKLKKDVNEAEGVVSKNWILEKLEALLPREQSSARS